MIKCLKCEGYDVIKHGFNQTSQGLVQKYKCYQCKTIFSYNDRLPRNHMSAEIVSDCIDFYMNGLSYRVIRRHLMEKYEMNVSHVTIYNWIQEYAALIKNYINTLSPKLSPVWQMDETWISFKGNYTTEKQPERTKGYWCWVGVDTVTRYSLDMYLSLDRTMTEGMKFFERIKKAVKTEPDVISTDGNPTYLGCIAKYYPDAQHCFLEQISVKPNTSFIERFNGTIKNRTKTMRDFAGFYPCQNTLTLFQIYYNYLRPHMALDGKTPAQAAGIDLKLPHRWASLIRCALTNW